MASNPWMALYSTNRAQRGQDFVLRDYRLILSPNSQISGRVPQFLKRIYLPRYPRVKRPLFVPEQ